MSEQTYEMPEGFADPSFGGATYETVSLKEDTTVLYRILPSMKSLAKAKENGKFWKTHWGRKGRIGGKDGKLRHRPFLCIQEKDFRNGGIITVPCAACTEREGYENKYKAIEAKGKEKGLSKAEIAKALSPTAAWLKDHGCDGKWRFPALNKAGQPVILKLTHTAQKTLKEEAKKLLQNGHTPMGVRGIWWEFTRTGSGFNTKDDVRPHRISRPDGSEVLDFHVLTSEIAVMALETLPDLNEEMEKQRITASQIEELIGCGDDPDEVDRILGIKESKSYGSSRADSTSAEADPIAADDEETAQQAAVGQWKKPAQKAVEAVSADEDDDEAAALAALAAARAKKAKAAAKPAAVATKTKAAPVEPPAGFDPLTPSEEELDNMFNT